MNNGEIDPYLTNTETVVSHFNDAFNRYDVDAIMALMTSDCVFENTSPAPDGERYEGQEAVRGFWTQMFTSTPEANFETEEMIATEDRCIVRWRYTYATPDGTQGHIRGVDIFRTRDGKVAEKLAYVKG